MKELTLIGKLGADAELTEYNGNHHLRFSIAVNEGNNEKQVTHWFNVNIKGSQSYLEKLKPIFKKGSTAMVRGNFVNKIYQDKIYTEVYADKFKIM